LNWLSIIPINIIIGNTDIIVCLAIFPYLSVQKAICGTIQTNTKKSNLALSSLIESRAATRNNREVKTPAPNTTGATLTRLKRAASLNGNSWENQE